MKIILKAFAVLFVFALQVKANTSSLLQIKIQGESGVFALPLDQPVATWAKIYGMGYHNENIPTSMGWSVSWRFHRIGMAVTFTGSPLITTEVAISANGGQQLLSLAEATAIAHSLGLRDSKPDPNMEGAPLWSGDHISVRFLSGARWEIQLQSIYGRTSSQIQLGSCQSPNDGPPNGRRRMRFWLADDPGAGKPIMAGLLMKELIARGNLQRCLVVCPGSLTEQWQDELYCRFQLDFEILTNADFLSAVFKTACCS